MSRPQLTLSAAASLKTAFTADAPLISQAGFLVPPSQ